MTPDPDRQVAHRVVGDIMEILLLTQTTAEKNDLCYARVYTTLRTTRKAERERMSEALRILEHIRDFPPKGYDRRTKDGYPQEIVYDEFSYKRMVNSYRRAAKKALAAIRTTPREGG